jgi:hypothetical protein
MAPGAFLAVYQTESLNSWGIKAQNLMCNNHNLTENGNETRTLLFDMSLPYLYLPEEDWNKWAQAMVLFDKDIDCSFDGYCKLN